MKKFYLDLAKICFGGGFYGCLTKLDEPALNLIVGVASLIMVVVFAVVANEESG